MRIYAIDDEPKMRQLLHRAIAEAEPEAEILEGGLTVDADVLKAGHHGSASASSQAFLDAVSPAAVVITCEADSEDGLPNERMLERFRACGAAIFRSDEHGLIVLRFKDGQISVGTER